MAEATARANQCIFARSALTVRRAVPPCCNTMLAQSVRAQHASNTTARANDHTHLPSRASAQPRHHVWSAMIRLATQTMKPDVTKR